jgi:(E)-4-hydroxy-3-methylbut-2-enyl-diphosphate synthase
VADIHFDYRLAIAAMENGADKIRINPGNIGSIDRIKAVVDVAKERNIPIRVGVNSGSLEKELVEKYHGVTAQGLAESALDKVRIIEELGYDNLVISIKSSDVLMCAKAHEIIAEKTTYRRDYRGRNPLFRKHQISYRPGHYLVPGNRRYDPGILDGFPAGGN